MKVVVGLGNPGRRYERTRHNVGFEVLDRLGGKPGVTFRRSWRFPARLGTVCAEGEELLLVKPETFMNRSGLAVAPLLRKRGLAPADLIVVLDDADLEVGRLRIRPKGSAGGHRGLQSIVQELGTEAFTRLRIGIGRGAGGEELVDFVLATFAPAERAAVDEAVGRAADAVRAIVRDGVERAMNRYN